MGIFKCIFTKQFHLNQELNLKFFLYENITGVYEREQYIDLVVHTYLSMLSRVGGSIYFIHKIDQMKFYDMIYFAVA